MLTIEAMVLTLENHQSQPLFQHSFTQVQLRAPATTLRMDTIVPAGPKGHGSAAHTSSGALLLHRPCIRTTQRAILSLGGDSRQAHPEEDDGDEHIEEHSIGDVVREPEGYDTKERRGCTHYDGRADLAQRLGYPSVLVVRGILISQDGQLLVKEKSSVTHDIMARLGGSPSGADPGHSKFPGDFHGC